MNIPELASIVRENKKRIVEWIREQQRVAKPENIPVYCSSDIRNSGFKISIVDTNLFPSGFNNLCNTFSKKASVAFKYFFQTYHPSVRKILIIPEEHTRNLFYWKNIHHLCEILQNAGFDTRVASASQELEPYPYTVTLSPQHSLSVQRLELVRKRLKTEDHDPDIILINNDLSSGCPEYLQNVEQKLLPSPELGWHKRRKSNHFRHYENLVTELAEQINLDPWFFFPYSISKEGVDLTDEICLESLKDSATHMFEKIQKKYDTYGIHQAPYLFLKNDAGTYGLGVTHFEHPEEILKLNRRLRNKLETSKGGSHVNAYLLQEGIPTIDTFEEKFIEPVVYLVGGEPVGTFFRIHEKKDNRSSLNSPGMSFSCLCLHQVCDASHKPVLSSYDSQDSLFTLTSLLGQIAALAAQREGRILG